MAVIKTWDGAGLSSGTLSTASAGDGDSAFDTIGATWNIVSGDPTTITAAPASGRYVAYAGLTLDTLATRHYWSTTELPASETRIMWLLASGGTTTAQLLIRPTGLVLIRDSTNTNVGDSGSAVISANTEYRISLTLDATGSAVVKFYEGESTAAKFTITTSGGSWAQVVQIQFGTGGSQGTNGGDYTMRDFAVADTAEEIPAWGEPPAPGTALETYLAGTTAWVSLSGGVDVSYPVETEAALLGGYLGTPNEDPDAKYEAAFGVYPDVASTYYQAYGNGGSTINATYETGRCNRGTIPLITVTSQRGPWTMAQIGAGDADEWIDYWVEQLAELPGEVWFTFDHEFEVKVNQGNWTPLPTNAEYASAFNRWQSRVKAGAPNAKFLYWYGYSDKTDIDDIGGRLDRPDIISLDPYVFMTHESTETLEEMAGSKLTWLTGRSWYDGQPIVFSEFAKDIRFGDDVVADFVTNLRPRLSALGVSAGLWFFRDHGGTDISADITDDPLSKAAFAASAQA